MRTGIRCLAALMAGTLTSLSAPLVFESTGHQPSLLELYTSEGCSSCPPAETWLSQLKDSPGLWTDFVPVAFHVDYWNYLGWSDPWSNPEFSDRQRNYVAAWGGATVYTPEFVLNGHEWHHDNSQKTVLAAADSGAGSLQVSSDDDSLWRVTFTPAQNPRSIYEAHAALLVSGIGSDVKAGENSGRKLKHDFAVIAFSESLMAGHSNTLNSVFLLNPGRHKTEGRLAIAVWVTPNDNTEPVQATGGWLTEGNGGAETNRPAQ